MLHRHVDKRVARVIACRVTGVVITESHFPAATALPLLLFVEKDDLPAEADIFHSSRRL